MIVSIVREVQVIYSEGQTGGQVNGVKGGLPLMCLLALIPGKTIIYFVNDIGL